VGLQVVHLIRWSRPGMNETGFDSRQRQGIMLLSRASIPALGPTSRLFNGYQSFYPWGKSGQGMKLTTHLHLPLRLKNQWKCTSNPPNAIMEFTRTALLLPSPGICIGGMRWPSWFRHCATNWKAEGSIPNDVNGIFHWHNPCGRIMALGSTQPLTEMSARNISWGVKAAGA
jgi:hypothetical protein